MIGFSTLTLNIFNNTYKLWIQWSFLFGEHVHLISEPIVVLYLFYSLSLKINDNGPFWSTKNNVILDATSNSFIIWVGTLERYGWERDIL